VFRPSEFRELVSGRRPGPAAALARAALRLMEIPYTTAVQARNRRYDRGGVGRVDVPVVSIGNLTLGGTGKTPLVEWVVRWAIAQGLRPAILSRGYKAAAGRPNDEALELAAKLPDVPHLQNPDRLAAAREAIARCRPQLLVLDDAFQHRRIHRDLDIVLLDALEPFGYDHVFPRGTLREPVAGLRRAQAVILSRSELLDAAARAAVQRRVASVAPLAAWAEIAHAPRVLRAVNGQEFPLDRLRDLPIAAFCGLGNPAGFRQTLAGCAARLLGFREFPDHHPYDQSDVAALVAWAAGLGAKAIVCTHKDLVKIPRAPAPACPLWALTVGVEFLVGRPEIESLLTNALRGAL
jgi:tetraacyldisaccharide 4'-kinase